MKPEIVILERIDTSEIKIISKFADIKFLVGLPRKKYLGKIKNATAIIIKSVTKVDSTDIMNMSISKKSNVGVFSFNITNLLDENYQRPYGYSQNGRAVRFGFRNFF